MNAVRREEFEEAPDTDASAKLAFGELHGWLVMDAPQEHGIKVHGQVHGHADAWWIGKALQVHMPRAMALGSGTQFLELTLQCAGHLDLSFWQRRSTAAATSMAGRCWAP
jgi:hypothetical protein